MIIKDSISAFISGTHAFLRFVCVLRVFWIMSPSNFIGNILLGTSALQLILDSRVVGPLVVTSGARSGDLARPAPNMRLKPKRLTGEAVKGANHGGELDAACACEI